MTVEKAGPARDREPAGTEGSGGSGDGLLSRRHLVGTAAVLAGLTVVPHHVLGGRRHVSPSEKVNIVGSGVAGTGAADLNGVSSESIVALGDVDGAHAAGTFKRYPRPKELEDGRRLGDKLGGVIGDKGKLICGSYGSNPRLIPESRMRDYVRPEKSIAWSAGHRKEWIEACKGGKAAGSNFSYAGSLTEMVLLGNIAVRMSLKLQEKGPGLTYDGPNMKITNLPEANDYLHREYRAGWTL